MIIEDSRPFRNLGLWSIFILGGLVICYLLLIALTSIFIGLNNLEQDGSWAPVLTGMIIIITCLYLFKRILKLKNGKSKGQENINPQR